MSEERFDRLEKMMEQLIKMAGANNSVTEELRQDMQTMKATMATKDDIKALKDADNSIMDIVEKTYQEFDQFSETQKLHAVWLRRLAADTAQNEAEIALLKKAK